MNKTNEHGSSLGSISGLSGALSAAIEPVRAAVEAAIALHPLKWLDQMLTTARRRIRSERRAALAVAADAA